jgi:Icc protein
MQKIEAELPEGHSCPRLLQITDTHLFGSSDKALLGVNTRESFHAILDLIESEGEQVDAFVATGDISQDDSVESYAAFAQGIARFTSPCYWLPGNHDDPALMVRELENAQLHAAKQIIYPRWQVLLLDSQVKNHTYGYLAEQQLRFVEQALAEYPAHHCLVLLHHNPIPVGCRWLDQHQLKNGRQFLDLLAGYSQVKGVIWGHVHQELDQQYRGIRLLSTPSTCIQFKPNCDQFTLDNLAPGYRRIRLLEDGQLDTEVVRLKDDRFAANMESKGY